MPAIPLDRNAWTEPGTFEVAPGVYRIPLPLPNDGLRAVNVYALVARRRPAADRLGLGHPRRQGRARPGPGRARRHGRGRAPDPGHPRAPRPLHPGHLPAARVRRPGQPGHRGPGVAGYLDGCRSRAAAEPAGLPAPARRRRHRRPGGRPAGPPRPVQDRLGGARRVAARRPGHRARRPVPGRGGHARPHPRPRRVPRRRRRAAVRGRPRAADHHAVDRVRADAVRRPARGVPGLADPDPVPARRPAAARARAGHRERARQGRRADRAPRPATGRGRGGHPRRRADRAGGRGAAEVDPARADARRAGPVQPDAGGHRDRRAPAVCWPRRAG